MPLVLYSAGKASQVNTPTLTASASNPTDGDLLVLECTTTTGGITSYQFVKNGQTIQTSASATLTFAPAVFVTNDGSYTCVAIRAGTPPSMASNAITVACELFNCLDPLYQYSISTYKSYQY